MGHPVELMGAPSRFQWELPVGSNVFIFSKTSKTYDVVFSHFPACPVGLEKFAIFSFVVAQVDA